ncbi:MAG: hypothetical protein IT371_28195 [Deltaproteobacteria bacterium]|nr:hypothetical protein [Deltaproteobacteria bacterium]
MSRPLRRLVLTVLLLSAVQCAHQPGSVRTASLPPLRVDPFAGLDPLGEDKPQAFTFRHGPKPPPETGEKVTLPFPPPASPGAVRKPVAPELKVLRTQPQGEDGLIGAVSATFNQPMVPVAALEDLARFPVPLKIEPVVPGRFRWLGTATVTFEPTGRMPFSTRYEARIPAGTRAPSGRVLEEEVRWSFATPRVTLVQALPNRWNSQVRPDTALAFQFNQPVAAREVLKHLQSPQLAAEDLEIVPQAEWASLKYVGKAVATWEVPRTVVLRPKRPLPLATHFSIQLSAGLTGEGPLPTTRPLDHVFSTYSPLRIEEIRCNDSSHCDPESGLAVRFNNPLVTADPEARVTVTPKVAELKVSSSGSWVSLEGAFKPRTKYTVRVAEGFKDIHGQLLAQGSSKALTTGDLYPALDFTASGHAVLEWKQGRQVPLNVTSVKSARLRMVKVERAQLLTLLETARHSWDDGGRRDPLAGIRGIVVNRTLKTGVPINGRARLGLATDEALGSGAPGVVYVELRSEELRRYYKYANPFRGLLVNLTDIALLARYDHDKILVLATGLQSGAPLAGLDLELRDGAGVVRWKGRTSADGTAELPGSRPLDTKRPFVLWGSRGKDTTFALLDASGAGGGYLSSYASWHGTRAKRELRMHLFTDRDPYRPGEKVHLKGILRMVDTTPNGGVEPIAHDAREAKVRITTARGRKLLEVKRTLSPSGAFAVDVEIPEGADLGNYHVSVRTDAGYSSGNFRVEEYRAPEFEVKVETPDRAHFFRDELRAKVGADYLFGAPMAGAEVKWTLRRSDTSFVPPNNDGFSFGEAVPWWFRWSYRFGRRGGRHGGYLEDSGGEGKIVERGEGLLDAGGRLPVAVRLERDKEDRRHGAASFTLEAEVLDQNRQSIAGRKTLTVHPASLYVGLRPEKTVIKASEPVALAAVLTGLDGKRVAGRELTLRALEVVNKARAVQEDGEWRYRYESREVEVASCAVKTAPEAASCELTLPKPGMYLVRAETKDERARLARTTIQVYAYGPGYVPWQLENQSKIELVADKASYRPGDTARILIKSPLAKSRGFLTLSRGGIASHRLLALDGNAQVVEVPIDPRHLPELHVGVALGRGRTKITEGSKDAARDLGRPTFAFGSLRLPVSLEQKTITVIVKPAKETVRPSETVKVTLETKDARGNGVAAELAVMVVDEGVLSLLGYQTPSPLEVFHRERAEETAIQDNRNNLLKRESKLQRPRPREAAATKDGKKYARKSEIMGAVAANGGGRGRGHYGAAGGALAQPASPMPETTADRSPGRKVALTRNALPLDGRDKEAPRIRSRSFFATTAYYNPSVTTGEDGRVTLEVKLPDNLTTFRIMAVALDPATPDRFGKGEAQVKVRKALLLRPSLPRFLSIGDRFEAAVMVHNETDRPGTVDVLVRGRNVKATGEGRKRVEIPAHRAAEVRFPMEPMAPGPARLQFAAVLGDETDAVEKQLPVLLPATTEAFATYGMTDASLAQPVLPPKNALPGYGGLEISMSSTALTGLQDAVRYLVDYPHGCTEQTASRLLPLAGLKDILQDFQIATLADETARHRLMKTGIARLESLQRWDGGWGMWEGAQVSWPYLTAYAMFALRRAKEAGYPVDDGKLARGARFLKQLLDYPRREFGEQYAYVTQTLSVWMLSELKQHEREHAKRLYEKRNELPLFARAWLMQALHRADGRTTEVNELLRELDNAASETASAAHFSEVKTESLRLLMHSEDRTDAIVLYALLEVAPEHTLLPKVVRGLIQARVRGMWSTTQSNAYALTALSRYYKQVEKVVPDYVARLWLGEAGFLGEERFKGRQMKVVQQNVPLAALQDAGKQDLIFDKQGPGKLYYRVGLRYAPTDLRLPPEEQGFAVTRTYEPVEGLKESVVRASDGSWRIKAGSTVRVRLTVVVPGQRYFVAVMDPLPAGLEAVNLDFQTSATSRLAGERKHRVYDFWSWYALFAFEHKELRDESVVLYADRLPAGVYEYTYLARATTLGRFVAAPTKAEEMYQPETFGRTGTTFVEVR